LYIDELIAPAGFQPSHRESFENVGLANVCLTVERSKADVSQWVLVGTGPAPELIIIVRLRWWP